MGSFKSTIITAKGHNLMAKLTAGTAEMSFTKLKSSDHDYSALTSTQLEALTSIENIKQEVSVSAVERINDASVKVTATLVNTSLTTGYYIKAIALYADDPDEGEILYSVTVAIETDWMPPYNNISSASALYELVTTVSNAENVSIDVDPTAIVSITQFNEFKESVNSSLSESVQQIKDIIQVNIRDFGAHSITEKGYENFDSTQAIQDAINSIQQTRTGTGLLGGKIIIPLGIYKVTNLDLTGKASITFIGASFTQLSINTCTILVSGSNSVGFDCTDSVDIRFESMRICGDSCANAPKTLLLATRSATTTYLATLMLDRVSFDGWSTLFHVFLNNCDGSSFDNCYFTQYGSGGLLFSGDSQELISSPFVGTYKYLISHSLNFFNKCQFMQNNTMAQFVIYLKEQWGDNSFMNCFYHSLSTIAPTFTIDLTSNKEGATLIQGARMESGREFIKIINNGGVRKLQNFTVKDVNLVNNADGNILDFGTAILERCSFEQPFRIRSTPKTYGSGNYTDCVFDLPNDTNLDFYGILRRCKTNKNTKIKTIKSTNQIIPTGVNTTITWDSASIDERGELDTANDKFIAPVFGYYRVTLHLKLENISISTNIEYGIKVNDSSKAYNIETINGNKTVEINSLIQLSKGQELTAYIYNTSAVGMTISADNQAIINYMSIVLEE